MKTDKPIVGYMIGRNGFRDVYELKIERIEGKILINGVGKQGTLINGGFGIDEAEFNRAITEFRGR